MRPVQAALVSCAFLLASPALADRLETTTIYPAPSGAFDTTHVRRHQFIAYETRADMDLPPMPGPGTFVYCRETDTYYASNANAVAATPGSWWYRIELDNTPENVLAQGSMDPFYQKNNTYNYAWIAPWTVVKGKLYSANRFIQSKIKVTTAGLYTAAVAGKVCEVREDGATTFGGWTNTWQFKLQLRLNASYVAETTGFTLGLAANEESDCGAAPDDTLPAPSGTENAVRHCYCAPFNLSGQLNLPVGNFPYVGLLSYGVAAPATNLGKWFPKAGTYLRRYAGYVVHVNDIRIYK